MFVNLDGWGVDTPYALVERVGRASSSEVLITLETQWFTRFATIEDVKAGDIVFGETGWREVVGHDSRSKKRFLADRYLSRIRAAGFEYTLSFEMVDEGGNGLFLVFGTHHPCGVEKMKDAMWSIDKVRGQRFRDPRDPNQQTFEAIDSDPDLSLLSQQVLERLEGGSRSLEELKDFALCETMFKKAHAEPAVRKLEALGKAERTRARKHEDVSVRLTAPKLFS
ncbi:MAG: three-Cys-motif partner protein TcmP [Acidimicrobiales bacterium]